MHRIPPFAPAWLLALSLFPGADAVTALAAQQPQPAPSSGQPPQPGHIVLLVKGNARGLTIVHAVGKPSAWPGVTKGLKSDFSLQILDGRGVVLKSIPLDMSHFDTRDDRIESPDRSECCKVITSRIAMLVNVPDLAAAKTYRFVRKDRVIGTVLASQVEQMRGAR